MKKKYSLILIAFLCSIASCFGQTSDLIISEYAEGSGNNKYIEIYNGTGANVDLSDYELWRISNGGSWPESTISLTGTLANGDVYIIAPSSTSPSPDATILAAADLLNNIANFNGDDAIGLAKDIAGSFSLIDVIGTSGPDPGTGWNVAGVTNATANRTLVRKANVCDPNTNWISSAGTNTADSEWIVYASNTWTYIDTHTETCSSTNTSLEFTSLTSTIAENGTFINVCVSITNPSATTATTVDIELDGSSLAINGTDYDDGASSAIGFPVTLTFPAGSSANQCLSIFVIDDGLIEGDETVVLNLANESGGNSAGLGTDTQHILTITDDDATFPADVVITEIMYNSSGNDDEWIEICNVSGTTQVLNNYTIEVGSTLQFTFPSTGALINDGDCIIIDLGDGGNANYNVDCPITMIDYSNGAGNGTLNNSSDTIELIASDGTTIIDIVTYDDGDGSLTDNNGASFHIIDTSLDNSVTSSNWWQTLNGGSPGINSLISPCTPVGPEINLEGTTANFPDIADGHTSPAGFDGTDFGGVTIGGTSTGTFRIENFGGTQNLTISSVTVASGDVGDFSISSLPSSPITALNFSLFDIEFNPTAIGTRTVVIEIRSNDSDEDPYTFTVEGNGLCAASAITAEPSSGPVGTIVTVTGTNLSAATASFNGLAATVNNISATEMEVTVPAGASSGNLEVMDDLGCPGTTPFTFIESQITSCEGSSGTTPTDLFISEVTDANTGGLTYIEIFNGTGATINLDNYSVQFFNNGNATENGGVIGLNNVNLATGNTYVVSVSTGSTCTGVPGADGSLADQGGFGGVNFPANGDDHIRLYDGATHIDSWGEHLSNTWADPLGIGSEGVVFTRNNTAGSLPNTTFNIADWTYVDWASCSDNVYVPNIGSYDFSTGTPPTVNSISSATTSCNEVTISVSATEGFPGGSNALAYQWYYFDPTDATLPEWKPITDTGIFSNSSTANLVISNANTAIDYQFYCEVREDDASCYTASDALKIIISGATWNGTNWTWNDGTAVNTVPTTDANVIINGDYNTSNGGAEISFEACECIVNTGNTLTIENNTYVLVENDLTVDGNVVVKTDGAFVQVNDAATVDGDVLTDKTKISVEKETAPLATYQEYTYWSSPVIGETIGDGLLEADSNRIFLFNGQNFLDENMEMNNDGGTLPGQDDIDDDANDWQLVTGGTTMLPGVGYASTHDPAIFIGPAQYIYAFEGAFNNGVYNIPIYRNDNETSDNNWNFIGNPYASAIAVDGPNGFLAQNATTIDNNVPGGAINGAIFLWSHNTAADGNTNGNEALNYSQSDYAIINGSGQTAGGDSSIMPDRYIPSGQGFFVSMDNGATATPIGGNIHTTNVIFNNSMRITGNNDIFFRDGESEEDNKLWLNLTSDNGVFNQVLVAYVNGATDEDDGMYFDAHKNLSSDAFSGIYSLIETSSDKKFAIQGKDPNSLDLDEIIPLGFNTTIDVPTIYTISIHQFEGDFMDENAIFVIDKLLNTIHNLKDSGYSFTSEIGEFNNRFEIVFRADALSINDYESDDTELTIIELENGDVEFRIGNNLTITQVEILDLLGRRIYSLSGNNSSEVYNLSNLSKATYIARVTLSNGQTISKKAIKRK